jgi:hypothetical protein
MANLDEGYPQDISAAEADLKFERLLIEGIGKWKDGKMLSEPVPVVARILSPSDVLIKAWDCAGRIRYWHWRWGLSKSLGYRGWHPLSTPMPDPRQLICDFNTNDDEERFPNDVSGLPFNYRAV